MSLRASRSSRPRACSGDMNGGVPETAPSCVRRAEPSSATGLTRPKSSSLTTSYRPPRWATKALPGLTSKLLQDHDRPPGVRRPGQGQEPPDSNPSGAGDQGGRQQPDEGQV